MDKPERWGLTSGARARWAMCGNVRAELPDAAGLFQRNCHVRPLPIAATPTAVRAIPSPISVRPVLPFEASLALAQMLPPHAELALDTVLSPTGSMMTPTIAAAPPMPTTIHGATPNGRWLDVGDWLSAGVDGEARSGPACRGAVGSGCWAGPWALDDAGGATTGARAALSLVILSAMVSSGLLMRCW